MEILTGDRSVLSNLCLLDGGVPIGRTASLELGLAPPAIAMTRSLLSSDKASNASDRDLSRR